MKLEPYIPERVLCKQANYLLCYYKGEIIVKDANGKETINKKRINSRVQGNNLIGRLLRYEPRAAVAVSDGEFIFSCHGKIYNYSVSENNVKKEHEFIVGMSNPLSFCVRKDAEGNIIEVLYGEYTQNPEKKTVSIYSRREGLWQCAFEFPEKTIKHIHGIFDDVSRKRFLILTGDDDSESGIWESDYSFVNVRRIVGGDQKFRSCVLCSVLNNVFFATDTPLEQNGFYKFSIENEQVEKQSDLPGPVIFGRRIGDKLFFSTSVEADSRLIGLRYFLSNKLGEGVKDRYSHLFFADRFGNVSEICKIKKDIYPLVLFGFGNMIFPSSDDDTVFVCPQSLKTRYGTYVISK